MNEKTNIENFCKTPEEVIESKNFLRYFIDCIPSWTDKQYYEDILKKFLNEEDISLEEYKKLDKLDQIRNFYEKQKNYLVKLIL